MRIEIATLTVVTSLEADLKSMLKNFWPDDLSEFKKEESPSLHINTLEPIYSYTGSNETKLRIDADFMTNDNTKIMAIIANMSSPDDIPAVNDFLIGIEFT